MQAKSTSYSHLPFPFVTHGRTRQSNSFNLKYPLCITWTLQAYFNRTVRLWNTICHSVPKTIFSSLYTFQNYVKETLFDSLKTFDVEWPCTWSPVRMCACHHTRTNFTLIIRSVIQIHFLFSILSCILYFCIFFFHPGSTSHGSPIRINPFGLHYLILLLLFFAYL